MADKKYTIKKVSIVIPAKDEEGNLEMVLDELHSVSKDINKEIEVIVVDDHSKDSTEKIALDKGARVIKNSGRSGKGHALRVGFKESTGDVIVMMDADYSHRAADLPLFLDKIEEGVGLVIGSRMRGGSDDYTLIRAFGNLIFTALFVSIFHRYLSDLLNGYKGFRREIFDNFKYSSSTFEIEIELAVNALRLEYSIMEVPSHERERAKGKVKSSVIIHGTKFLFKMITEGFKFYLRKK